MALGLRPSQRHTPVLGTLRDATHDVVVLNAAVNLLHLGLQRAKAPRHRNVELAAAIVGRHTVEKVAIDRQGTVADGTLEGVARTDEHRQTVLLQERTLQRGIVAVVGALLVVRINRATAHAAIAAQREVDFPRKYLREVGVVAVRPAVVEVAEVGVPKVLVANIVVHHQRRLGRRPPLDILLELKATATQHIVVGQPAHVARSPLDGRDAAAGKLVGGSKLERQPTTDVGIDKSDALRAGTDQPRIAAIDGGGRRHDGGIQVGDARAADAGGVVQLQRLTLGELVLHAGLRNPVVQTAAERGVAAVGIAATHIAVLVANAGTRRPPLAVIEVVHIGSHDTRHVVETLVAGSINAVELLAAVAVVVAVNVLRTDLHTVTTAQRPQPVGLQRMLGEALARSLQMARIVEGLADDVAVGSLVVRMLARQGEHVRECELLALQTRLMLVVQTAAPRLVAVAGHPSVALIAVAAQRSAGGRKQLGGAVALHVQLVEVAAKGGRQQVQRVNVVTGTEVGEDDMPGISTLVAAQQLVARMDEKPLGVVLVLRFTTTHTAIATVGGNEQAARLARQRGIEVGVVQRVVVGIDDTHYSAQAAVLLHDDVENGIDTLRILAGSRVGDDFDALHHRGWHRLQDFLGVLRQAGVQVAVLVNAEVAVALHRNIVLAVDRHHRHLAQHVHHRLRLCLDIGLHVIAYAVYLLLDELSLGSHRHLFQLLLPSHRVGRNSEAVRLRRCLQRRKRQQDNK